MMTLTYSNERAFMYDTGRVEYQVLDEDTDTMVLTQSPSKTIVKMVWAVRAIMPGEMTRAEAAIKQLTEVVVHAWDKVRTAKQVLEAAKEFHMEAVTALDTSSERVQLAQQEQGE